MIQTFFTKENWDYELLDTGEGEKLERLGKYTFIRPYEDAFWPKTLTTKEWQKFDGKFYTSKTSLGSGWKINKQLEKRWIMSYKGIKFWAMPTPFRHFGFFPEQASHWDLIETLLRQGSAGQGKIKFLNLFGYTGVASLFALRAGAEVTHVDASKQSLTWAKENQELSGLEKMPMRIICDDVLKFLEREIKRGQKYDCVIMDPPKFGRGPKGEVWKIEEKLPELLEKVGKILSDRPLLVILTSYATDHSSLVLGYALEEIMKKFHGKIETGELCVPEKSKDRAISLAHTAVWTALEK